MKTKKLTLVEHLQPVPTSVVGISALALIAALGVVSLIFAAYGIHPLKGYQTLFKGAFGSWYALSETLTRTIPLLIVGSGLTLAFQASTWNIGAEGQILLGACAATWIALFSGLPPTLIIPAMFLLGFLAGGLWALLPGYFKAKFSVNETIVTLMLNYVASNIVLYLIHGPWKGKSARGFAYTDMFPKEAWLNTISGTRIPILTLALGFLVALACYIILRYTTFGFRLRVSGQNPQTAKLVGIKQEMVTLWVMFLSGGLSGVAGAGEVGGIHHLLRHPSHISLGYGYTAIIVAWLARANPLAVPLSAFLFGALMSGGDALKVSLGIPFQMVHVFNGLIIFFLIAGERFMRYGLKLTKNGEVGM